MAIVCGIGEGVRAAKPRRRLDSWCADRGEPPGTIVGNAHIPIACLTDAVEHRPTMDAATVGRVIKVVLGVGTAEPVVFDSPKVAFIGHPAIVCSVVGGIFAQVAAVAHKGVILDQNHGPVGGGSFRGDADMDTVARVESPKAEWGQEEASDEAGFHGG